MELQDPDRLLLAAHQGLHRKPVTNSQDAEADFRDAQENMRLLLGPSRDDNDAAFTAYSNRRAETRLKKEIGLEKALFLYAIEKSVAHLEGYASLDFRHMSELVGLQDEVVAYDNSTLGKKAGDDDIRSLNWLITSGPGSGKSHLVSCIAKSLRDKVSLVCFNMATMRSVDDLIHALDEVRNGYITGKLPMLFLDEVDNVDDNFGLLLPLLWDGQIQVGIRTIRIGRAVIVAAGSKEYLVNSSQPPPKSESKYPDFRSRITFHTALPKLTPEKLGGVDQVCTAIAILRHAYNTENATKEPKERKLLSVPVSLLNFIYRTQFRYGVRSIRLLLEHLKTPGDRSQDIDDKGTLIIKRLADELKTPETAEKSGLVAHIKEEHYAPNPRYQLDGLVRDWDRSASLKGDVPIWCKSFSNYGRPSTWKEQNTAVYNNAQLLRAQSGQRVNRIIGAGVEGVGVLYFDQDRGVWEHGMGRLRHIFFNLNTIATIIHHCGEREDDLRSLGREMGEAFGSDFGKSLKLENGSMDMKDAIERWCQFDVSGGWGLWRLVAYEAMRDSGNIAVENSFFVEHAMRGRERKETEEGDHARGCTIMSGYIAGVLEAFSGHLGRKREFEVEETKCGIEDSTDEGDTTTCTFRFGPLDEAEAP